MPLDLGTSSSFPKSPFSQRPSVLDRVAFMATRYKIAYSMSTATTNRNNMIHRYFVCGTAISTWPTQFFHVFWRYNKYAVILFTCTPTVIQFFFPIPVFSFPISLLFLSPFRVSLSPSLACRYVVFTIFFVPVFMSRLTTFFAGRTYGVSSCFSWIVF